MLLSVKNACVYSLHCNPLSVKLDLVPVYFSLLQFFFISNIKCALIALSASGYIKQRITFLVSRFPTSSFLVAQLTSTIEME